MTLDVKPLLADQPLRAPRPIPPQVAGSVPSPDGPGVAVLLPFPGGSVALLPAGILIDAPDLSYAQIPALIEALQRAAADGPHLYPTRASVPVMTVSFSADGEEMVRGPQGGEVPKADVVPAYATFPDATA